MSDSLQFALFFVGVFLLTGALVVGVGALEYEVRSLGTAEDLSEDVESLVSYDDLSPSDREIVDRALAGERVVIRDPTDLPGPRKTKGKLAVERDGKTHVFTRRIFFNWRTRFGASALAMVAGGLAAISEAVRRHHFPHRPAYWIQR